jgi:protein-disulfide isomerase
VKLVRSPLPFARAFAAAFWLAAAVGAALAQTAPTPAPSPSVAPAPEPAAKPSPAPSPALAAPAPVAAPVVMVPIDQLMGIGPLPDIVQGSPSAAVTIIEYASMTCSHCAAFHDTTWPELKAKYIDSGRAKFILREFPLDPLAAAAFMLARCAGPEKRNIFIDQLFAQQKSWAFVDKPIEPLLALVKSLGMTQVEFETCLRNQDLYEQVNQSRERAAEAFNIDSTPTFFVNGRKMTGELAMADFDKLLDPTIK